MPKMPQIEWDEKAPPARNASRGLPVLAAAYFVYVREVLAAGPAPAELHAVRLATKRLRYTLELFRPCYGPALESRLEALKEVQKALGDLNDSVATAELLRSAARHSPQRTRLVGYLEQRAQRQARDFRKHWTEVFDAPGREPWWTGYLSGNGRAVRRRS